MAELGSLDQLADDQEVNGSLTRRIQ